MKALGCNVTLAVTFIALPKRFRLAVALAAALRPLEVGVLDHCQESLVRHIGIGRIQELLAKLLIVDLRHLRLGHVGDHCQLSLRLVQVVG